MISIAELARALDAEAAGDVDLMVRGPAEPGSAGPEDIAVAMGKAYAEDLPRGRARAAILWQGADWRGLGLAAAIFVGRPRYALAGVTRVFARPVEAPAGVHATALVDPTAEIGAGAAIGPYAIVGPRVRLGANACLLAHVTIAEDAVIGAEALLHPGVRIGARVVIGARFIAQPGAVIGGDGFSFVTPAPGIVEEARERGSAEGGDGGDYLRINSLGAVRIGDDVEVGANACIDRGTIADTTIGDGTKIDNLVQIGHNVRIGRTCLICGCVAIGGSTVIGDRVVIGGAVAVADNVAIGSNVVVTGFSGVGNRIPPNRVVMGTPAIPIAENMAILKAVRRLPRTLARLEAAQKRVSNPDASD